jgi:hypothetical protein
MYVCLYDYKFLSGHIHMMMIIMVMIMTVMYKYIHINLPPLDCTIFNSSVNTSTSSADLHNFCLTALRPGRKKVLGLGNKG